MIRFFIDRGGTFTDVIGEAENGDLYVHKVLSQKNDAHTDFSAAAQDSLRADLDPSVRAIEEILERLKDEGKSEVASEIRIGTTVATNALLTRSGERVLLVTNKGLGDALRIGYQNRPDIFALKIEKPKPLYEDVIELSCRHSVDGEELNPFNEDEAREKLLAAREKGFTAVAILFMHGYRFQEHENACAKLSKELGFTQISPSHLVSPMIKFVSRGDTTLVDAYLSPPLRNYTEKLCRQLNSHKESALSFMKSDGGLAAREHFTGKDALLSGPAGGVVGAVSLAQKHHKTRVVGFDMGGTSTDVSYFGGEYERQFETMIDGVRVRTPMLAVHTVAAGGGSILDFQAGRLTVGPESAGARPGPACYGAGGPLTVTDANLILGRISENHFPKVFGKSGKEPIDKKAAITLFQAMAQRIALATGDNRFNNIEYLAAGFLNLAVEKMARAIAKISTEKGHDVKSATLVAFGGAGGQHACLIAERLSIKEVLVSPLAGVLSAYGIAKTERSKTATMSVRRPLDQIAESLGKEERTVFDQLRARCLEGLNKDDKKREYLTLFLRYEGSDSSLPVLLQDESEPLASIRGKFEASHERLFGFVLPTEALVIEEAGVEIKELGKSAPQNATITFIDSRTDLQPLNINAESAMTLYAAGKFHNIVPLGRSALSPGKTILGPALIADATATTIVEPGWQAEVLDDGSLLLKVIETKKTEGSESTESESDYANACPMELELFNNIFMSIAEEMGVTLQNVSHSVNIKERLDFSCAIFDEAGRLIANAPHMPVHLGSMGESVVSLLQATNGGKELKPGQVYASNNPYNGGTHLPDITVISPLFYKSDLASEYPGENPGETQGENPGERSDAERPQFFLASRGHHADIGGITPGSMPPLSKTIEEEGILLDNFLLVEGKEFREAAVREALSRPPYPARNPARNISDLKAQVAANQKGILSLTALIEKEGLNKVKAYMGHVRANAAQAIREVLSELSDGAASCKMDDGSEVVVKITIDKDKQEAQIDFSGTTKATENNFNAPRAVVRAAVLYVFRTLCKRNIPLNDGCMTPLSIYIDPGSLLSPEPPRAVVAGNVETSQIIVDTLYLALGKLAASQGTMNNLTFGDALHQYYETIAGGSGAGENFDGASAVQTHMTNSRLTDPEILESRFPVRLREFKIREGSGGMGRFKGGDGVRRAITFIRPMSCAILSTRRLNCPPGLFGAQSAKAGANTLERADGKVVELSATDLYQAQAGDTIIIETPGGGGYGPAPAI